MRKLTIFSLVVAVMVMTLAVGFSNAEAKDKVYKWDMTYPLYRGTWDWAVLEKWCAHLKEASGGRRISRPKPAEKLSPLWKPSELVPRARLRLVFP